MRALQLHGSLARGAADEYSDVDCRVWISTWCPSERPRPSRVLVPGTDDFRAAVASEALSTSTAAATTSSRALVAKGAAP